MIKVENYMVATLDSGLLLTLKEDRISLCKEGGIFSGSERICLTISELQDIIFILNSKKISDDALKPKAKRKKKEMNKSQLIFKDIVEETKDEYERGYGEN